MPHLDLEQYLKKEHSMAYLLVQVTETEPVCSLERWPSVSSAPMSRSTQWGGSTNSDDNRYVNANYEVLQLLPKSWKNTKQATTKMGSNRISTLCVDLVLGLRMRARERERSKARPAPVVIQSYAKREREPGKTNANNGCC